MANRFTKSVLERQAMEAKRRGKAGAQEEASTAEVAAPAATPAPPPVQTDTGREGAADTATQQAAQEALTRLAAVQGSAGQEAAERISLRDEGEPAYELAATAQSGAVEAAVTYGTNEPAAFRPVPNRAPRDKAEALYVAMAAQEPEPRSAARQAGTDAPDAQPATRGATVTSLPKAAGKALPQADDAAIAESVMQNNLSDLVASYLIRTPERMAKNKTFYLDEVVINGIRSAAKKQKVTESKLVNDILRGVLGIH